MRSCKLLVLLLMCSFVFNTVCGCGVLSGGSADSTPRSSSSSSPSMENATTPNKNSSQDENSEQSVWELISTKAIYEVSDNTTYITDKGYVGDFSDTLYYNIPFLLNIKRTHSTEVAKQSFLENYYYAAYEKKPILLKGTGIIGSTVTYGDCNYTLQGFSYPSTESPYYKIEFSKSSELSETTASKTCKVLGVALNGVMVSQNLFRDLTEDVLADDWDSLCYYINPVELVASGIQSIECITLIMQDGVTDSFVLEFGNSEAVSSVPEGYTIMSNEYGNISLLDIVALEEGEFAYTTFSVANKTPNILKYSIAMTCLVDSNVVDGNEDYIILYPGQVGVLQTIHSNSRYLGSNSLVNAIAVGSEVTTLADENEVEEILADSSAVLFANFAE